MDISKTKSLILKLFAVFFSHGVLYAQPLTDYSEILVRIRSEQSVENIRKLLTNKEVSINPLFKKNSVNRSCKSKIWHIYSIKLSSPDFGDVIKSIQKSDFVEWAEYRNYQELFYTPNDPSLGSQYYLALIRAFEAWDISLGDSTTIVGIVDTGTDPAHVELVDQIAYNYSDPVNGIDDDGDGFIDNFFGWNIAENNYNVTADIDSHGVNVSGIVAAKANNGIGIAGVAPGVKFLPVKIMNNQGLLKSSYEGIVYAAEHGCKIIVCSWGSVIPDNLGREVIKYVNEELDVLVVAAAGNSRNQNLYYPASYPGVVSVLATNQFNHKWEGSTYGYRIDIAAPGQNILSTSFGNTYSSTSGTSNAAPIIAGVASIISAMRPHLKPNQILSQLQATALWLDTMPSNVLFKDKMGAGRVDMYRALSDTNIFYLHIPINIIDDTEVLPGETYRLKGELTNLLCSKNGITVTISPLSEYVSIANNTFTVNYWQSGTTIQLWNYNIRLNIDSDIPLDYVIPVRFNYTVDGHSYNAIRTISTCNSWYDIDKFDIKMTLSNVGKPAYHRLSPLTGNGFRKGSSNSLLWEAGLIVGKSEQRVVSAIEGSTDFFSNTVVEFLEEASYQQAEACFTDFGSENPVGLNYKVKAYTGGYYPLNTAMIYEVTVTNYTDMPIENIRVGMFANWLVRTGGIVVANNQLQLVTTKSVDIYPYVHGLAILSNSNSFNNYSFDTGPLPQGININDNFSLQEMWFALNNYREMTQSLEKTTPAHLTSTKISALLPGNSDIVRFAFFTDSHTSQIEQHVIDLSEFFSTITETNISKLVLYPNPTSKVVMFSVPADNVLVFSLSGEKVYDSKTALTEINVDGWNEGVYIFVVDTKFGTSIKPIIVIK